MLARLMRPMMVTPLIDDGFLRAGEFAIAAAFGGEIDDHGTRRHAAHHLRRDQHGRFLAGDDGGGDDHVVFRDDFAQQFALARVERFVLRGGVAAGVLRVLGFDGRVRRSVRRGSAPAPSRRGARRRRRRPRRDAARWRWPAGPRRRRR